MLMVFKIMLKEKMIVTITLEIYAQSLLICKLKLKK